MTLIAGSSFVMWMGEQVNEFGVGNGISIILFAGILARVPNMISGMIDGVKTWSGIQAGSITLDGLTSSYESAGYSADLAKQHAESVIASAIPPWGVALIVVGILALIVFIVFISDAERRIPVQYAKRQVGRKMYGGQSSNLPMKVNMSGVLPIIFAQSIATLPITIWSFIGVPEEGTMSRSIYDAIDTQSVIYMVVYFVLIIGFSFLLHHPVQPRGDRQQPQEAGRLHSRLPARQAHGGLHQESSEQDHPVRRHLSGYRGYLPPAGGQGHQQLLRVHRRHLRHHRGGRRAGDGQGPGEPDADASVQGLLGVRGAIV